MSNTRIWGYRRRPPPRRLLMSVAVSMESRKINGYVAVRRLMGNGWVYLKASKTGLHLLGLPSWADEAALRTALQDDTCALRLGARVAHAETGASRAAEVLLAPGRLLTAVPAPRTGGLARWREDYVAARDERAVRAWADAATATFETREKLREEARRKAREGAPDEDGFVTVVGGPSVEVAEDAKRKRKAGIEPEGFYRWQKRQKADVDGLRQRFAEVKKRVAAAARLDMPEPSAS